MTTRMLIDARHPEETRVAVLKGNRIEEFDFESADRKQIKGNIYLAKVTRVEPSLQAAFVDFGGNRHGFLAFSEIHPDYYQIPRQDREALLAEEEAAAEEEARLRAAEEENADDDDFESSESDEDSSSALVDDLAGEDGVEEIDTSDKDDVATIEDGHVKSDAEDSDLGGDAEDDESDEDRDNHDHGRRRGRRQGRARSKEAEELRAKRMALRRRYKIQDVIQRRQVLLVQVVKEERGNKGAALTTYLSLAGRYTVLMPNSSHGGGISRKISSSADRKRLKQIVAELKLPKTMGCIIRTAGLQRTKTEIKRDFDYLARLWDEIRENTLSSTAPAMIHSDSDLVKRAIRDIYNREIEEVVVEGEDGYKAARQFMKLLMPSHARRVKQYADPVPLFQRYGAEDQLTAMYDPVVQLKSGGYLVINPTEALVSIDINSGRSTKEHGIEATALSTNLEAAKEIARQLRLRDMAGLVVIDFIDMEYSSNTRKVERAMKDALKHDRARIQVGRISGFGLMEMSRQRLRTGVLEATTRSCPHCDGTGLVRTASSAGLSALRLIEEEAAKGKGTLITLYASTEAAIYLLNQKRGDLAEIEERYGVTVEVLPEGENEGAKMRATSAGPRPVNTPRFEPLLTIEDEEEDESFEEEEEFESRDDEDNREPRKKRRRRGGRNRRRPEQSTDSDENEASAESMDETVEGGVDSDNDAEVAVDGDEKPKKRRRRGGRRRKKRIDGIEGEDGLNETSAETPSEAGEDASNLEAIPSEQVEPEEIPVEAISAETEAEPEAEKAPAKPRRTRRKKAEPEPASEETAAEAGTASAEAPPEAGSAAMLAETGPADEDGEAKPKPKRRTRRKKADADTPSETAVADASPEEEPAPVKPKRTRRKKAETVASEAPAESGAADIAEVPTPETQPISIAPAAADVAQAEATATTEPPAETQETPAVEDTPSEPPRRGWWQRTFGE
ncbi:ribonuclease [Croceicoccus estronivorus]|uniref:ribonuclease E/G n=1 Tax=Croceicoccus estronivorus TaxID=1172626 RepID=UPI00082C407D|nr:ribonuclease E/G [Croceicoccus estronivorus]OCC23164.1 ribonuclease [Croceicoccus estronivorus]